MQIETAVAGAQIELMAFDDGDDMGFHAVERQIEAAVIGRRRREGDFALADRQRRGPLP